MMRKLAGFAFFVLTLPALAAPFQLRSEVPVSEPEYAALRDFSRADARIATDGNGYLAVWTDSREGGEPTVYAARLRADGSVVDPIGLRVVNGAHAGPVVWTGRKWLLSYDLEPASRTFVRTMTPDGVFGEPIEVGRYVRFGAMGTNGTNVLLILSNEAMLLDLDGHKLKDVALTREFSEPHVAAAGSTYLVANELPQVSVQTVSSDGVVGPTRVLAQASGRAEVGLATDGEQFLVVWPDKQIFAQFVTAAGEPDGPVRTLVASANGDWPSIGWRDGEYFLVYSDVDAYAHYAMRVAADASPIGAPKRLGHGFDADVEMATAGGNGIALLDGLRAAVFDEQSVAGSELFRRVVDVGVTARTQTNVHLARLGDGYVAAWVEDEQIFLSTAAGTRPIAVVGSSDPIVDVIVDRSNIIWVLWSSSAWVAVTRFHPWLQPIDAEPVYIGTPGHPYATAAAGDGVIALAYPVEDDDDPDPDKQDMAALLLWETGNGIARQDVLLTAQPHSDYNPTVAFDGSAFVYAWSHAKGDFPHWHSNDPQPVIELVGARVSTAGELLDATPVQLANDVGSVWEIDSARGANGVAIAWRGGERPTRMALFGGPVVELDRPEMALGELAPHDGGFLLLRSVVQRTPALTQVEYSVLGSDLTIRETGALPPFQADTYYKWFDVDVIGGASPVFAYVKNADGRYGNVPRVFVRRTGEAPPRRRAIDR